VGITPAVARTLDNLAKTMCEDYSNPLDAQMTDLELVFNYLFPFGDTYNRDPAAAVGLRQPVMGDHTWLSLNPQSADTTHLDLYLYPPGLAGNSGGSFLSEFLSLTEDTSTGHPAEELSVFNRNAVMFNGPDPAQMIDTTGTGWTRGNRGANAGSLHEFAHTFNKDLSRDDATLFQFVGEATDEVFSSAAEQLIGQNDLPGTTEVPYAWPLLGLNRNKPNGCLDPWEPSVNYQNWRSFAAYLLYNYRGADTSATVQGFRDDLFYKWAHATPTEYGDPDGGRILNYNRTLEYLRTLLADDSCATCAARGYFHTGGQALPTIDRLALLHHHWRVASYVNNPALAEGQYGFAPQSRFWPASNINAWHSSDGCSEDDVVSVPPELTMSRTGAHRQMVASKFRSLAQNGGSSNTYPMDLNLTGAEYWILRGDASLASGGPYTLQVRVAADSTWRRRFGFAANTPDSTFKESELRLVASVIGYTSATATDSLWRHPEWATLAVAPQFVDLDSLERAITLSVPNFGSTYKAALVVITAATGRDGEPVNTPVDTWYEMNSNRRYVPYRVGFAISDGATLPSEPLAVASEAGVAEEAPTWRPTNDELAYVRTAAGGVPQVVRKRLAGGMPATVFATADEQHDPDWSPRGDAIVFARGNTVGIESPMVDLWVAALDGTATRITTDGGWKRTPVFNPNGRTIAYAAGFPYAVPPSGSQVRWSVWTVGIDGTAGRQVVQSAFSSPIGAVRWSPEGTGLWFKTGDSLYAVNVTTGEVADRSTVLPAGVRSFDLHRSGGPIAIEQSGSVLWTYARLIRKAEDFRRIALYDTTGRDADPLLYQRGFAFYSPRWSVDGTKVAYASGPAGGDLDIHVGTGRTNHAPVLSPGSTVDAELYTCSLFSRSFSATDADGEAVTYELMNKPPGMIVSGSQIRWIPTTAQAGNYDLTLRAKDGSGGMDQRVMRFTVGYAPELCTCRRYPYCVPAGAQPPPTEASVLPTALSLSQNQPNPFSRTTAIRFAVPTVARVRLEIFDLLGRRVRTLVDEDLAPAFHARSWDANDNQGQRVRPGIYMVRMTVGGFRDQKKMLLVP
jgi:Tol biopolymer transport system component